MQGVIIGAVVQGVTVEGRRFAGGAFDWLNAYSVMTGFALVFGYALLGATWLVMKTETITQQWARKCAAYALGIIAIITGHLAKKEIRQSDGLLGGDGLATAGLVLGYANLVLGLCGCLALLLLPALFAGIWSFGNGIFNTP